MNTPLTWQERVKNSSIITTKMIKGKFYLHEKCSTFYYEFENLQKLMECLIGVGADKIICIDASDKEDCDKYEIIIFDTRKGVS